MKLPVMWLFVATGLLAGGSPPSPLDLAAARRAAREEASRALRRPVAGIQIAAAYDGSLMFVDSFGLADAAGHRPVTNETVFHVASISKNILAGVVVRLVEQHRLSLDDDVTKYAADAPTRGVRSTSVPYRKTTRTSSAMFAGSAFDIPGTNAATVRSS